MKRFNETYGKRKFISRNEWADTYKAIHAQSEEKVIVKLLVNKSDDEKYINNLSKEVSILKDIKNDNLIHINDMFQYSACGKTYYYIESEYFKAITLEERIKHEQFSSREAVKIVEELSEVIKELHNRKLLFDILSIENIFINSKNVVKIDALSYLEKKNFDVNIEENEETFNPHKDIYALGAILYSLLSGEIVFEKEKYKKYVDNENLLRIIEKATNKDLEEKYTSVDRLIIDLKSYLSCGQIKEDDYDLEDKVLPKPNKKKNKLGKSLGICATLAMIAGAGVYAYDLLEKNNLESENNNTKLEETIKVDEEMNKKEDTTNEKEDAKVEENKEETVEKKKEDKKTNSFNQTSSKNESETDSSTNSNSNNSNSNQDKDTNNRPNSNNTSKPNNTNKPSGNTNKPSSNPSKPNNNQSSGNTTTKPNEGNNNSGVEQAPEVTPNPDNSNNDNDTPVETPDIEVESE